MAKCNLWSLLFRKNTLNSVSVQKLDLTWEGFLWEHIFEIREETEVGISLLKKEDFDRALYGVVASE